MRRRTVPSQGPAVIPGAVSLAGLSIAANGKSARDHKNPNIPPSQVEKVCIARL